MEPQIPFTIYFSSPANTSNNPFFINSTMTWARKRPKRTHTVDRSITTQATKKPKSTQTRASEWGSLLPPETENQTPQIPSESSLSSLVDLNLGFHNSVQGSARRGANLDSHNTSNSTTNYHATCSCCFFSSSSCSLSSRSNYDQFGFFKVSRLCIFCTYRQTSKWIDLGTWL